MRKIVIIILICLINGSYVKPDVYNDICELLNVYDPESIEHHKKERIQIVCLYDCINDSLIEGLSFKDKWNSKLDSIGVYSVSLANESHGIEFILFKIHENYMIFHNIEPNRTKILRELIRISKNHSSIFTATKMNNIMHNIISPNGSWIKRQVLSPVDTLGNLKLYFHLDLIRNKSSFSKSIFNKK